MSKYLTLESLIKSVEQDINEEFEKTIEKDSKKLYQNNIFKYLYVATTPENYDRTYEFLDSADAKSSDFIGANIRTKTLTIFNDINEMSANIKGVHTSLVNGSDQRRNIALWMDEGHGGIYNVSARNFMKPTEEQVFKMLCSELGSRLRKYGIVLK